MKAIHIAELSGRFTVRRLDRNDVKKIVGLCAGNPQFYQYSPAEPTEGQVISDMSILPPGVPPSRKYYVGFLEDNALVAVMDLIDGYPDADTAFIGFFMLARERQGHGLGSAMIAEALAYLTALGYSAVRLCIDEGNPQSTAFWTRNGFHVLKRIPREKGCVLLAERPLSA